VASVSNNAPSTTAGVTVPVATHGEVNGPLVLRGSLMSNAAPEAATVAANTDVAARAVTITFFTIFYSRRGTIF